GPQGEPGEVPADLRAEAESLREKLIEAVCEQDDDLIAKYLEGEELTAEEIKRGLRAAVLGDKIVPVLAGAATTTVGVRPLLSAVVDCLPSAADRTVRAHNEQTNQDEELKPAAGDPSGSGTGRVAPLAALVFKTAADPFRGNLTYLRVYSGTLRSDSTIYNS